jgi:uncharacterized sporulation protein YeaH/YhbH (DUF444 family)
MSFIIDRRSTQNKTATHRKRFLDRHSRHIKEAVRKAIQEKNIQDVNKDGIDVTVPVGDLEQPSIMPDQSTGNSDRVHNGNKEFVPGDQIPIQGGGSGQGKGSGAGGDGEGDDDFVFNVSHDEFLEYLFEDLELPDLVKKQLKMKKVGTKRAGFSSDGLPQNLDIQRTFKHSIGRHLIAEQEYDDELKRINSDDSLTQEEKDIEIEKLKRYLDTVPFLEDVDMKFKVSAPDIKPDTSAVMFCIMDTSGSMTAGHKDLAKRFYILLYLFLQRQYKDLDIVFIRYHTVAKEVSEEDFFYSRETGGTIASTAFKLMSDIMSDRYSPTDWNIYVAHTTDGDDFQNDLEPLQSVLETNILPSVQYYSYVELKATSSDLLPLYQGLATKHHNISCTNIHDNGDVYPSLRKLFTKKGIGENL